MTVVAALTVAHAAAATPAGTTITNTARLTFTAGTAPPVTLDSNTVTIAVDALVEAAITAERPTAPVATAPQPLAFTVTNPGNATTSYRLRAAADRDGITVATIAADSDDDGRYDPAIDRVTTTVTLAAGAQQRIFVLAAGVLVPGAAITVTATADTPAAATVGATGGQASATTRLVALPSPAARLDKAQSVAAPGGGTRAIAGAVVTYTLTARFARDCAAAEVSDAVPDGMRFVPGSITLDDQPLADTGRLDGTTVRIALGDMSAGAIRQIRFNAIIL
ncbi:hypothetical protein [Sphingomonas sp. 8AM]|uniref:hypothetical protein n=1 Tax=Sphingomonas sp. 8AM TaxID=2653170 RepID=UPI00135790D5|nr:hypothetical protein [Sphingomonas sp. 8AM]